MPIATIATSIANTVTLGNGIYADGLTITNSGTILPAQAGAASVLMPGPGLYLHNFGVIEAGAGIAGHGTVTAGPGGTGVDVTGAGSIANQALIIGGAGGTGAGGDNGGTGGDGVALAAGATLINQGSVQGGAGGAGASYGSPFYYGANGGLGGIGVDMTGAGLIANQALIIGGAGGTGYTGFNGGTGGGGVALLAAGGTLVNHGTVQGGAGGRGGYGAYGSPGGNGGVGGTGFAFSADGTAANFGIIAGGAGGSTIYQGNGGAGGSGVSQSGGGTLTNSGTIAGGTGGNGAFFVWQGGKGGQGGDGLILASGSIAANDGFILGGGGGNGGSSYHGLGGAGGAAGTGLAIYTTATATNRGEIAGGTGGGGSYGGIGGAGGAGLVLMAGGTATNSGTLTGGTGGSGSGAGVFASAGGTGGSGLLLTAGGTAVNDGAITGGAGGGGGSPPYAPGTYGVGGTGGTALALNAGGYAINHGVLTGGTGGTGGAGTMGGTGGIGLMLSAGATASNDSLIIGGTGGAGASGFYSAGHDGGSGGVGLYMNGGILLDSGTISGGAGGAGGAGNPASYASGNTGAQGLAVLFGSAAGTLVVESGAVFVGEVMANATVADVLEFAGTSSVALPGIGTQFENFNTLSFASGAQWTIAGDTAGLASGETISGFTTGSAIDLTGVTATSEWLGNGILTLSSAGSAVAELNFTGFDGLSGSGYFSTHGDGAGGTVITADILCFMHGTHILTGRGDVPVEDLVIGDRVMTRFSGMQRIKWLGRQSYARRFLDRAAGQWPVKISAGALGEGLPRRALYVSPGHSLLLGGTLVLARQLVNGITVTQRDAPEEVHYVNIELETHDCVRAEGAWAETYADCTGFRARFHNAASFFALYPDYVTPDELKLCAPRPLAGAALEMALAPVVARAAAAAPPGPLRGFIDRIEPGGLIEGWANDLAQPELPVLLAITLDGLLLGHALACMARPDLAAAGIGNGQCSFSFQAPLPLPPARAARIAVRRITDGTPLPAVNELAARLRAAA